MNGERRSFLKLLFFFFAVMIAVTRLTDADLIDQENVNDHLFEASTLDFANQSTANNTVKSLLFNITGLVPGGFQVETVRVRRKGDLGFKYEVKAENYAGDAVLCQALDLMVLQDWQTKYNNKLAQLNFQDEIAEDQDYKDIVLVLKLSDGNSALAGKTCGFDLKIKTLDEEDGSSFSDEEVLTSQVSTSSGW